jgi:AcrR family transcriptional regulator
MAPRAYNNATRQQQQLQLKVGIAAAAARLHAEKGALATSYADIAERAGVSLPTVYKHFPDFNDLIRGCTAHVASSAPVMPAEAIMAAPGLAAAAQLLVEAIDNMHAYYEPWLIWREQSRIPALAEIAAQGRDQVKALCNALLARDLPDSDASEVAAVWESLLHFEMWHRLVRVHKLARATVRRRLVQALLAACGPQPVNPTPSRPAPRRSS